MGRVKQIEIRESTGELLWWSRQVFPPLAQARLRAFYLYQSGQERDYGSIGQQLGYERHAKGRWFKQYGQKGLSASLQLDTGGNPTPSVLANPGLREALKQKLADAHDYFTSYKQIQQWLLEQHGLVLSYGYVHRLVRYELGAKLKVVRKSNQKKDTVKEDKFKKN